MIPTHSQGSRRIRCEFGYRSDGEVRYGYIYLAPQRHPVRSVSDLYRIEIPGDQVIDLDADEYRDFLSMLVDAAGDAVREYLLDIVYLPELSYSTVESLYKFCGSGDDAAWNLQSWPAALRDKYRRIQETILALEGALKDSKRQIVVSRMAELGVNEDNGRPGYVYLLKASTGHWKIGRTSNPENRLKTFGVKLPFDVKYECLIMTSHMAQAEQALHDFFAAKRIEGEWFDLNEEDVRWIKTIDALMFSTRELP